MSKIPLPFFRDEMRKLADLITNMQADIPLKVSPQLRELARAALVAQAEAEPVDIEEWARHVAHDVCRAKD